MTFYPQCRVTLKGQHRLHDRINSLIIAIEAITVSANLLRGLNAKFSAPTVAALDCVQIPISVKVPVWGPLEAALNDQYPDQIHVDFYKADPPIPEYSVWTSGLQSRRVTFGFVKVVLNVVMPVFVEFYESYKQFLYDKFGGPEKEKWPMVWRFGWAVRNAMAHNGCIDIRNSMTVSWYGLTYSKKNNTQRIMGIRNAELGVGDIVVLMFEMNDELDQLNCPFAL